MKSRGVRSVKQHKAATAPRCAVFRKYWLAGSTAGALLTVLSASALAADAPIRSQFGSVGMIDTPSARMAPDGELSVSASYTLNSQRYSLGFQVFPWLETSFRYSGLEDFHPLYPVYFDRAFGVKLRLWDESEWRPAIAIGTNDLIGTGIYSSEYIVASKSIGVVDISVGMGWGRMATANTIRNPLSLLSKSFDKRVANVGFAGDFDFGRYFHGHDVGLFGGVSWRTPIKGLTLIAEYSSDKYVEETKSNTFAPVNQFNFGASYSLASSVTLGLGWLYGRSFYGNLTFSLDPTADNFPQRMGPALPPPGIRSEEEQVSALRRIRQDRDGVTPVSDVLADILWRRGVQNVSISGQVLNLRVMNPTTATCATLARDIGPYAGDMRTLTLNDSVQCILPGAFGPQATATAVSIDLPLITMEPKTIDASGPSRPGRAQAEAVIRRKVREQGLDLLALSLRDRSAILYYENGRYLQEKDAIDRLLRILMADAPPDIEAFRFISVVNGMPQAQVSIPRGTAERTFTQQATYNIFRDQGEYTAAPMNNPILAQARRGTYPQFNWSIFPQFRQQFFDPVNPLGVQFVIAAEASVQLLPSLRFIVQGEANLFSDFNVKRPSDSVLPHVRTDFVRYFSQGKTGMGYMLLEDSFRISPNVFATLRAGYLESMFAGVGGEVLWQPEGLRWALGWDVYHVKQREFDRLLSLQHYTQTTGHMTFYYASPWYNLDFQFRFGRYLAGDWGVTFQVTRRFAAGIEIGVFATKTNVTAAQFGEGSFDKGIIIRLPLSHLMPVNTQQTFAMDLRPVQRDGGQTLLGDAQLYDRLRRASEAELRRTSLD